MTFVQKFFSTNTHSLTNRTQCITPSENIRRKIIITILLGINDLYCSHNIVRVDKIEKNEMGRGEERENLRERDHLGDPGVDGRIILRQIFRKWDVGVCIRSNWLSIGTGGRHSF